jgi:aspartyl-tRNA synthetase
MTQRAEDLMMGAPAEVPENRLKELHLKLNLPKKKVQATGGSSGAGKTGTEG